MLYPVPPGARTTCPRQFEEELVGIKVARGSWTPQAGHEPPEMGAVVRARSRSQKAWPQQNPRGWVISPTSKRPPYPVCSFASGMCLLAQRPEPTPNVYWTRVAGLLGSPAYLINQHLRGSVPQDGGRIQHTQPSQRPATTCQRCTQKKVMVDYEDRMGSSLCPLAMTSCLQ